MKTERSDIRLGILFILLVIFIIFYVVNKEEKKENIVENVSYSVNLMIEDKLEFDEKVEEPIVPYVTHSGDLTGYSADCPACNGTLACKPTYNVYKNGVVSYYDNTYGFE